MQRKELTPHAQAWCVCELFDNDIVGDGLMGNCHLRPTYSLSSFLA